MYSKEQVIQIARRLVEAEKAIRDHKCDAAYCFAPEAGPQCETGDKLQNEYDEAHAALIRALNELAPSLVDKPRYVVHDAAEVLNTPDLILVTVEGGAVIFLEDHYEIELARIKNRASLLEWIHHMAQKTWVTNEMIVQFIEKVCVVKGWPVYPKGG